MMQSSRWWSWKHDDWADCWMELAVFAWILLSVAACAPVPAVPERVAVEVPAPCVRAEDRPARPVLRTEADLLAMDRYRRTIAAWSDLRRLEAYAAELEAVVEGCARIPEPRPPA